MRNTQSKKKNAAEKELVSAAKKNLPPKKKKKSCMGDGPDSPTKDTRLLKKQSTKRVYGNMLKTSKRGPRPKDSECQTPIAPWKSPCSVRVAKALQTPPIKPRQRLPAFFFLFSFQKFQIGDECLCPAFVPSTSDQQARLTRDPGPCDWIDFAISPS